MFLTPTGMGRIDNQKHSTPCNTDLINSVLPAYEREAPAQALIYPDILSMKGLNWAIESLDAATGMPRYLKGKIPWLKPVVLLIISVSVGLMPAEKKLDLDKLIFKPEHSPNQISFSMIRETEVGSPLERRMRSSAYTR